MYTTVFADDVDPHRCRRPCWLRLETVFTRNDVYDGFRQRRKSKPETVFADDVDPHRCRRPCSLRLRTVDLTWCARRFCNVVVFPRADFTVFVNVRFNMVNPRRRRVFNPHFFTRSLKKVALLLLLLLLLSSALPIHLPHRLPCYGWGFPYNKIIVIRKWQVGGDGG